tara:strand:- start:543 stop:941 length:399 start_codon:yes stop_codon:yes gene_type:complete
MKPIQGEMWEPEYPEWLTILDRLNEVNISDADNNFIKDIEKDYESINIVDEAKKFEYYWSGKRKLKTNQKGSWKLGWKNWLDKTKRQKEYYERTKQGTPKNSATDNYFRSKEYLQEVRRKQEARKSRRSDLD